MAQPLVKKDDDRDDEAEYSPFLGIEKGAVLQEARVFNDPQLDARRCSQVITKLLYLLNQGETFTKTEAKTSRRGMWQYGDIQSDDEDTAPPPRKAAGGRK
uniref:Uncharacterized protein n=1 Tax=Glycine max TaxID=3847 RepID=C6TCV9_SOYBN|nr:unknown [Glycine max]